MSPTKQPSHQNSTTSASAVSNQNNKSRFEYLTQWRSGLWIQIRQKEDAIWRFISFYAAAVILAAGFVQPSDPSKTVASPTGILLIILILFIVTFWGLLIVLDANYWTQRNLIFIGNIEREILPTSDLGVMLPKSYTYLNKFRYARSYVIHLHILFTTLTISLLAFRIFFEKANLFKSTEMSGLALLISILFVAYLLYLFRRDEEFVTDFADVRKNAPGKAIKGIAINANINYSQTLFSSPISTWGWSIALLCSGITAYLIVNIQPWFVIPTNFINGISLSFYILIIAVQLVRLILVKASSTNKELVTNILHWFIMGLLSLVLLMAFILFANTLIQGNII